VEWTTIGPTSDLTLSVLPSRASLVGLDADETADHAVESLYPLQAGLNQINRREAKGCDLSSHLHEPVICKFHGHLVMPDAGSPPDKQTTVSGTSFDATADRNLAAAVPIGSKVELSRVLRARDTSAPVLRLLAPVVAARSA